MEHLNNVDFSLFKSVKAIWSKWDVKLFILLSLFLQSFLILFTPLRKRMASGKLAVCLWSAYLLADWAANFAVGQISTSQTTKNNPHKYPNNKPNNNNSDNPELLAFWAPFLLVHLGGPDTITAFSLEDNELWHRNLLSLIFQAAAAVYVFIQSLPGNRLWTPTVLVFASGLIKYLERSVALYLASMHKLRDSMLTAPDPGPNYAKIMTEYYSKKKANLPTKIETVEAPVRGQKDVDRVKKGGLNDVEVVLFAHRFFEMFKGLIVDMVFSFSDRSQSQEFFLAREAKDAFRVVEVELNFMYEVLFTKARVVYNKWGYSFRFIASVLVFTSLGLFYAVDKSGFAPNDVAVTYTLLLGGIALDMIAFAKLVLSDWRVVKTKKLPEVNLEDENPKKARYGFLGWLVPAVMRRRWSESVATFNLISYCLNPRGKKSEKIIDKLGLTFIMDKLEYVEPTDFKEDLRDHIFGELKMKTELAGHDLETAEEIIAGKGDWVLRLEGCSQLLPHVNNVDYDKSLLLWHVATELCYCVPDEPGNKCEPDEPGNKYREFSKLLSDYMLYLLIMQPKMMSPVAGIGQIRYRDTCAEAKKFFADASDEQRNISVPFSPWTFMKRLMKRLQCWEKEEKEKEKKKERQRDYCKKILDVYTDEVKPVTIKGDKSKSVLFDGCILAKELKKIETGKRWEIMSKVWVEMLSYAAIRCRAISHAQQLTSGGELVTIVWLLMVHFGLGNQFQINESHDRAKLIVGK